jgi:hypothetical protein
VKVLNKGLGWGATLANLSTEMGIEVILAIQGQIGAGK